MGLSRTVLLVAAVVVGTVAAAAPAVAVSVSQGTGTDAPVEAATSAGTGGVATDDAAAEDHCPDGRAHPDSDRLGFENGCWYDDPIDVDNSDGLNDTELDAVVSRTMARIERIRKLEFEETVPVEVISRTQYRNETAGRYGNVSTADRIHQNVKFEALFMVGEDTDTIEAQQSNRASTVLGFYSSSENRIVIVSEDTDSPQMDELTLSHELAHALQDQHFDLSRFNGSTEDAHNAESGLIEGDAHFVETLYTRRCDDDTWDCVTPTGGGGGGGGGDVHLGLLVLTFQPYSDGPYLVQQVKAEGGWEAVNQMYENPPESSEQVIHIEKYRNDTPTEITVEDRSNEEWEILDLEGSIDHATFGEAGLYAMFLYPYFHSDRTTQIVEFNQFLNYKTGTNELQEIDPYNYAHYYTTGWDGDKLYPYVNDTSAETGETAYVWKIEWDSPQDAREFVTGYERLLRYYGAQPVVGHDDTWRIDDSLPFGDAFWINRSGTTVVIVNAPTVEDLSEVRAGAAPVNESATATPTPGTSPPPTGVPTTAPDTPTDGGSTGGIPGFGVGAALAALAGAALLARRR